MGVGVAEGSTGRLVGSAVASEGGIVSLEVGVAVRTRWVMDGVGIGVWIPLFVEPLTVGVAEGLGSITVRGLRVAVGDMIGADDGFAVILAEREGRTEGDTEGVGYGLGIVIFRHCLAIKSKYIFGGHGGMSEGVPAAAQPKGRNLSAGFGTITGSSRTH